MCFSLLIVVEFNISSSQSWSWYKQNETKFENLTEKLQKLNQRPC